MPRVKSNVARKQKVKGILEQAKGFSGRRKSVIRLAKQHVVRAGMYAFAHRRKKKGDFRRIWNVRINAALEPFEMSYSKFIYALKKADIQLNRKSLAWLAAEDNDGFKAVVEALK